MNREPVAAQNVTIGETSDEIANESLFCSLGALPGRVRKQRRPGGRAED
jgi:hypothetical protein